MGIDFKGNSVHSSYSFKHRSDKFITTQLRIWKWINYCIIMKNLYKVYDDSYRFKSPVIRLDNTFMIAFSAILRTTFKIQINLAVALIYWMTVIANKAEKCRKVQKSIEEWGIIPYIVNQICKNADYSDWKEINVTNVH